MTEALIELCGVTRTYVNGRKPTPVLHDINLRIQAGEMVAIMGRSGSGKSTLLNILGCLDRPSSGSYRIAGVDTRALSADQLASLRREHFGFIFQRYDLLAHLTALENVGMPALYAGVDSSTRRQQASNLLIRLGLKERMDYRPTQLSGGQQQRVCIARALINGAQVILADEPTGALDRSSHKRVLDLLRSLNQRGYTVIIVTHDQEVANSAERIIGILDGRIVSDQPNQTTASATPKAAHAKPKPITSAAASSATATWFSLDRLRTAMAMAWSAMYRHRLRSMLTMLGIVIGIASVIIVTGLGEGAKRRVIDDLRAQSAYNSIDVYPGADWGDERAENLRSLTEPDLAALRAQPYVESVSPVLYDAQMVQHGNAKLSVNSVGVGEDYLRISSVDVVQGATFSADDITRRAQVAVIGERLRQQLFGSQQQVLGEIILVGQVPFRIKGVARPHSSLLGENTRLYMWLPYTTQMARLGAPNYFNSIKISLRAANGNWQQPMLEDMLRKRHGNRKDFMFYSNDEMIKSIAKSATTLTLMVSAIAVVSLLVGGIGVMNIMLVSISERTREIGIRMAVGARQGDIRQQFLIEAMLVCLVGGVIGIGLAWLVGLIFGWVQSAIVLYFSPAIVAGASLTALATGVIFGFIPARNAARLNPTEALARQ